MHTLQRSKHNSDHHGVIELPRDAWTFFSLVMTRPQNTWTQGLLPLGETLPITLHYFHHHLWIHKENMTTHNKTTEKFKKCYKNHHKNQKIRQNDRKIHNIYTFHHRDCMQSSSCAMPTATHHADPFCRSSLHRPWL